MTEPAVPAVAPPDDKDWTWVLDRPCPECGYDAAALTGDDVPARARAATDVFVAAMARTDVKDRPAPEIWSPLEYACHVRDVLGLFAERGRLILEEDDPTFANWDQDKTAVAERYWAQEPAVVATQLQSNVELAAAVFTGVSAEQWQRPGRRSNGSVFSLDTLGRYFVHDLVHHEYDIRPLA